MSLKLPAFLTRFLDGGSAAVPKARLTVIPRDEHSVSRKNISRAALDVLYGLHKADFEAYLVGGCLRDMLTDSSPKDFDVVTDATPEEIKQVFKRARIIGRRFRLAHVRFGPDVIEVATFRASHDPSDDDSDVHRSDAGMILRDNVYGSIEEDALRRDFTINALYYNIADFALYDFVGSLDDIKRRRIRLIGDPESRYREDPVRMLRAARFAAKLGFEIDGPTEAPIRKLAGLLHHVPPARLFDEVLKLFMSGHGRASLEQMERLQLLHMLFPETGRLLENGDETTLRLIEAAVDNTDRRLAEAKPVTPAFLLGIMLWPVIQEKMQLFREQGMPPAQAMHKAAGKALSEQVKIIAIPKRFSTVMREIWELQIRLEKHQGRRALQVLEHPRFRAAYDFLLLREQAGEIAPGAGDWWTQLQNANETERHRLISAAGGGGKRRRRGGRNRGRRRNPS